ncbi:RNA binding protein [Phytophthora cinnamomi]|uniref:RNA binding protein n=1 Tax=Phytophthora cinnamomi TaxID=4785 RepID=UPI00355A23FA|nr:RNA binding protein [Phytophthora cinnamomi]
MINVAKKITGKKRNQVEVTSAEPGSCFYCFEDGHRKNDCPTMAKDRDPKRLGGALFRSNIRAASSAKKKRLMAVKGGPTPKKKTASEKGSEMTTAKAHAYDQQLANAIEDADEFAFDENVPVSEGEEAEDKAFNPMDIDAEDTK